MNFSGAALRTVRRQDENRWSFLPSQRGGISSQSSVGSSAAAERKRRRLRGTGVRFPPSTQGAGAEFSEIRAKL